MYAIVLTGGKQIKADVGSSIFVEKIDGEEGFDVVLDKVLYVGSSDGDNKVEPVIGTPFIDGATVNATIVKHGRGKKLRVLRYKAKSNVRVHRGHRQPYTVLKIVSINL